MPKTICLIGPPGSGKTTMAALTAPGPVHFLDIDRKVLSMASLRDAIAAGDVTAWPLAETMAEEKLSDRVKALATREAKQVLKAPLGWIKFAEMADKLGKDPVALQATTWVLDSATHLVPHLTNIILHYSGATAGMSPREWGYFLRMWAETITQLRDTALSLDKNLIVTVHERVSEIPLSNTKLMHEKDREGNVQRVFLGQMGMKISPSIDGQFGLQMASYFEEVYGLRVEVTDGKPKWICRVKPDGLRDLRTSCDVKDKVEFDCDFRAIWK
jgi:hypothetical protein